ncbi:MAG: DUF2567 domain-containing protein [Mycobacterium sp.]
MNSVVAQPRTSRGSAAVRVVLGLTGAGAVVGALWVLVAPPAHGVVALSKSGERVHAYLGNEADNFFVAATMLLGMLTVLAVVAAVAVWQWRAHRGPVMAVALTVGCTLGALAAAGVGTALARWHYGKLDIDAAPVTPDNRFHYFTEAPSVFFGHNAIQMATGLLIPAMTAALVYALLAIATARDDLGAYPPVTQSDPVPITRGSGQSLDW